MAEQKRKVKQGTDTQKPKKAPKPDRRAGRKNAYARYAQEGREATNKAAHKRRAQKQADDARIRRAMRQLDEKPLRGAARAKRRAHLHV